MIGRDKTNFTSVESPQLVGALYGRNVDKNAMSSDAALAARDFFGGTLGGMTGDSTDRDFPNKKNPGGKFLHVFRPSHSMDGVSTYFYHKNQPNVVK